MNCNATAKPAARECANTQKMSLDYLASASCGLASVDALRTQSSALSISQGEQHAHVHRNKCVAFGVKKCRSRCKSWIRGGSPHVRKAKLTSMGTASQRQGRNSEMAKSQQ
jgi:hypothetical protein